MTTVIQSTTLPHTKKAPMSQVDAYAEYIDVIRPPDAPRGNINEVQLLSQTARVWWMRTKNSLDQVLADDYWSTMTDVRLLREDTISLVSSYGAEKGADHSVLVVTESDKHGRIKVALLHRYVRS
jgi:hypothetical protein